MNPLGELILEALKSAGYGLLAAFVAVVVLAVLLLR